ncbi:MAG: TonB-dependent receptor [Bacteroidota bacterium]
MNFKKLLSSLFLVASGFSLAFAQISVTGKVTDGSENLPVIGASVFVKGTDNGTITDFDGNYKIDVPEDAVLLFSYIGYEDQEIAVAGQSVINIILNEDIAELGEVVVVGYGVQKKSVVTGAISKIKSDDLESMPISRLEGSLQGRTSGVRVTTSSGQPGAGSVVRIRGTTSITNSDPLFVVDGVPIEGGIDYLSQGDIESIEVLKDAASAGIYGARSANGVVLVTTKKGKEGKMEVNYNSYIGIQNPWKKVDVLNAREYGILMNEASVAAGGSILFENPDELGEGTDWQEEVFNKNALIHSNEISFNAGNERSSYFASFSFFSQEGIVSPDQSKYERISMRMNTDHKITDRLKVGNTLAYSRVNGRGVAENTEFGSPLGRALNLDPLTPLYETDPDVLASSVFTNFPVVSDENGVFGISEYVTSEVLNPIAALAVQHGKGWSDKIVGSLFGEWEIIDGLRFRSSVGTDLAFWGSEGFTPVHYLNASNRVDINSYGRSQNRGLRWILESFLAYDKTFGKHDINLVAGGSAEQNAGRGIGGSIQDLPIDDPADASLTFPNDPSAQSFYGFEYDDRLISYFGRATYNFDSKYLLSVVLRTDGSTKFGDNNKFGFFPSVSLGWVLTEEEFLRNNQIINFLKIRGSWGINGSDRIGTDLFVSTVGGDRNYTFGLNDDLFNGVSPNAIANPDLRWEETTQINVGVDARIFKRITITIDYFQKNTRDMLLGIAVPGFVGNVGPVGNIATMENSGFELELGFDNKKGPFTFDFRGNISYNQNEVTFLGEDKEFLLGATFSPQGLQITRTTPGLPIGYFFGYQTDGLFQNQGEVDAYVNAEGEPLQPLAAPGDIRFIDLNQDGIIDAEDRTIIGDPSPAWTLGFTFNAEYKGFDIRAFGQGVMDVDIYKATRRFDLQMANLTADALGRWTGEGTSDHYPRLVMNDPNRNFSRSSDFYVEDGAYFRLKTLQIGYSLPTSVLEKLKMDRLRIYVSGNNLFTLTNYSGFDPEIGAGFGIDRGIYPQARFYLFGINATF